jgi:hypothetical protein
MQKTGNACKKEKAGQQVPGLLRVQVVQFLRSDPRLCVAASTNARRSCVRRGPFLDNYFNPNLKSIMDPSLSQIRYV